MLNLYRSYLRGPDHPAKLRILGWIERWLFRSGTREVETSLGYRIHANPQDEVDRHVLKHGVYEPLTLEFIRNNVAKGETVVCSGTAYGLHLMCAADAVGEGGNVVGIDPQPSSLEGSYLNLAASGLRGRVKLVCAAIGSREGWLPLTRPQKANRGTFSFQARKDDAPEDFHARMEVLEDLLNELGIGCPKLLVLDIEGSEEEVIGTFRKDWAPQILISELHPWMTDHGFADPEHLFGLLDGLGYEVSDLEGRPLCVGDNILEHNFVAHRIPRSELQWHVSE